MESKGASCSRDSSGGRPLPLQISILALCALIHHLHYNVHQVLMVPASHYCTILGRKQYFWMGMGNLFSLEPGPSDHPVCVPAVGTHWDSRWTGLDLGANFYFSFYFIVNDCFSPSRLYHPVLVPSHPRSTLRPVPELRFKQISSNS